jgi:putative aldouronate transport system permease protein
MNLTKKFTALDISISFMLLLICFCTLYPFYNLYVYAFNDGFDSLQGPLYLWPRRFTLVNISMALSQRGVLNGFKISILRTVIGTTLCVMLTSSLGYAMTKRRIYGYKFFSNYFFIVYIFSAGFIPYFLLLYEIRLTNTFWVLVIPGIYSYWYMIIFRTYFDGIPDSIEQSAQIDGASYLTVFTKLIMPLSKPVYAAITLFVAVGHWNDWFSGMFYIKNPNLTPLQTILQRLMNEADLINELRRLSQSSELLERLYRTVTPRAVKQAVFVVTVTPIVLVYPFLQKYFAKGIMLGSIKG